MNWDADRAAARYREFWMRMNEGESDLPGSVAGTAVLDPVATEQPSTDDSDSDAHSGWFCVATDPFLCPGCSREVVYLTAGGQPASGVHPIIVWPSIDDANLLDIAAQARNVGRNPQVKEYEKGMGKALSYYELMKLGRTSVCGRYVRM